MRFRLAKFTPIKITQWAAFKAWHQIKFNWQLNCNFRKKNSHVTPQTTIHNAAIS